MSWIEKFSADHWQLYPSFFFIALSGIAIITSVLFKKKDQRILESRRKLAIVGIIAISITVISMMIFPIKEIPNPEGEFSIGTVTFELTDSERIEKYGDSKNNSDNMRRIRVQVWYPSDDISGYEQAFWLQDGIKLTRSLAKEMNLPFFVLDHTTDILSNAYLEAPISDYKSSYPVIILSHGWKGFRNLHNDFAELLSSNGFIVFGIDHTYGSQMTVFEDGFAAEVDKNALPDRDTTPRFLEYANQLVETYAGDIKLVLNSLDAINNGQYTDIFSGNLDLSQIGLMGHSTGGGADVSVALSDDRIKAILGMDAWVEPLGMEKMTSGLLIPALFLRSEQWEYGFNDDYLIPLVQASNEAQLIQIAGTTHIDFTMSAMFSSLTGIIGFTGELDRETSASIQHDYVLEFFNQTLKANQQ